MAPNYNALLLAIINTNPRGVRELRPKTPPEVEEIIRRAMAKNRDERYPTAKHFLRELTPPTESARIPSPPSPEERKRAPVLGGGRVHETARSSAAAAPVAPPPPAPSPPPPPEPASAALHVNMRGVERERVTRGTDESTQFDFKRPVPLVAPSSVSSFTTVDPPRPEDPDSGMVRGALESESSFDIPIDVDMGDGEVEDADDRTEIWNNDVDIAAFRAGVVAAAAASPPASSARVLPTKALHGEDDCDGETMVNRPDIVSKTDLLIQPAAGPARTDRRPPKAFNPGRDGEARHDRRHRDLRRANGSSGRVDATPATLITGNRFTKACR